MKRALIISGLLVVILGAFIILGYHKPFTINVDTSGKTIRYNPSQYSYYIMENSIKKNISIQYAGHACSISKVLQNKERSFSVFHIRVHQTTKYRINGREYIVPQQSVLLVSGKNIKYIYESPAIVAIQLMKKDKLQILEAHRRIIVNRDGKVESNKKYKKNII